MADNWKGASVEGNILKLEDGVSEVTYIYDCGEKQSAKFVLTAKEHEHAYEWVIDKDATATENGLKHEECSCGLTRNENTIIPATGTTVDKNDKNAKDTADKSAETGDDANLALWAAILLISAAIAVSAVLYNRKKHTVR